MGWLGVVETPDGSVGISLGAVVASTANLPEHSGVNGNTGSSEGSFNNQSFFANSTSVLHERAFNVGLGGVGATLSTDQVWGDGNPPFATNGHSVDTEHDTDLLQGQQTAFLDVVVERNGTHHSPIEERGAFVDGSAIPEADIEIGGNFATPNSEWAIPNFDFFQLKDLASRPFGALQVFGSEGNGFVEGSSLRQVTEITTGQGKNEGQDDQYAL